MPDGTNTLAIDPVDAGEHGVEALGELVDIGLKIGRAIERQVSEAGAPSIADLNAAAMAYARVARAVRQTVGYNYLTAIH